MKRNDDDEEERQRREVAPTKASRTYEDNVRQAKYLRTFFGHMLLTEITQPHIYKYLDERGKSGQIHANRELALLSHMFRYAVRWGDLDHSANPYVRIQQFKGEPRNRYIEDGEYYAFRAHAGPLIAAYMDFKYLTGLRQRDILALRRDQIKDDGIHVTVGKTGDKIVYEWTDKFRAAIAVIGRLKRPRRGLYLFCTRTGQPYTGNGFRSIWQRKMRSAIDSGLLKERFRDHDIRAKAASDAEAQHAIELMGHQEGRITEKHYRRKPKNVRSLQ